MVLHLGASDVCVMPDSHCVSCTFGSQTLNCALKRRAKCQSAPQRKESEMVAGSGRGKGVVMEEKMPWVELAQWWGPDESSEMEREMGKFLCKKQGRKSNFLPGDTAWHASPNRHTYDSLLALWSQWGSAVMSQEYKYCNFWINIASSFISFVVLSVL